MAFDTVDNPELIQSARLLQQESTPSTPPPGSWRETSQKVMVGIKDGQPWLYAELQRANHDLGWRSSWKMWI